jgi:hypothetical protein
VKMSVKVAFHVYRDTWILHNKGGGHRRRFSRHGHVKH